MKYLFILNPISGSKNSTQNIIEAIDEEFAPTDHPYEFACTTHTGDARIIASSAAEEGFDCVVAAGGDGTINEVASGLVGKKSYLGIIPLGSGNGIARSLKIPLKLKPAIRMLLNPTYTEIDIGQVNDHFFVGICGLGFDASIGKKFQDFGKRGRLPYFLIGFREYFLYQEQEYTLTINGQQVPIRPLFVAIANTPQYGVGALIAPRASPRDGFLDVCILPRVSLLRAAPLLWNLFRGTIDTAPEYGYYRGKEIKITHGSGPCIIHTDGEPHVMPAELNIRIIEKALTVCSGNISG
jgi:diacylglycerol kinase (ATP)